MCEDPKALIRILVLNENRDLIIKILYQKNNRNSMNLNLLVNEQYSLFKKIGFGSFSGIYHGKNSLNDQEVAIKLVKSFKLSS